MVDNKFLPFYKKGQRMAAAGNSLTGLNAFLQRPFPPGEAEDAYLAGFYPETVIPKSPKVTHERIIRSAKMPPNPTEEETLSRIENGMISGKGISADDYDYYSSIYGPEVANRYLGTLSEDNWTSDQAVSSATPEEIAAYQASRSAEEIPDYSGMSFKDAYLAGRKNGEGSQFYWTNKEGKKYPILVRNAPNFGRNKTMVATTPSLDPVMSDEEAAASVNDFNDPVAAQPIPTAVLPMQGGMPEQQRPMSVGYGGVNPMGMNRDQQLLQRFLANRARQQQSRNQSIVGEP